MSATQSPTPLRERLVLALVGRLQSIDWLVRVDRDRLPGLDDLKGVASTQLPLAAVAMGLPQPRHARLGGESPEFLSALGVEIRGIAVAAEAPDRRASTLAADLWLVLFEDQWAPWPVVRFSPVGEPRVEKTSGLAVVTLKAEFLFAHGAVL